MVARINVLAFFNPLAHTHTHKNLVTLRIPDSLDVKALSDANEETKRHTVPSSELEQLPTTSLFLSLSSSMYILYRSIDICRRRTRQVSTSTSRCRAPPRSYLSRGLDAFPIFRGSHERTETI